LRLNWKILLSIGVFALCIAPTIISYESYSFRWDDSDYLIRSITVSKAAWSGDLHGVATEIRSDIRPPMMSFLSLPWGSSVSWAVAGKSFISLTVLTAFFVACSLYLLLGVGIKPLYLAIASVSAFAALGPYPVGSDVHFEATSLLADSLFAWIAFAGVLLIPYEAIADVSPTSGSISRGILWGIILSAGAMTKASFLYFILLIVPVLLVIRIRRSGFRSAVVALSSLVVCSIPTIFYWLRYGLPALRNGWAASYGHDAPLYNIPISEFLSFMVRQSPGLLLGVVLASVGLVYWASRRRDLKSITNVLPLLIILGYLVIGLASSNRQIRYLFPGIIAPPFLVGLLLSSKPLAFSRKSATVIAALVFCCLTLAGVPMLHRPDQQAMSRCDAVLNEAHETSAKRILMATDSPTLNRHLMKVAIALSPVGPSVSLDSLAGRTMAQGPIGEAYGDIDMADMVVFQNQAALNPPFTNSRFKEYDQYAREHADGDPIKLSPDVLVYRIHHNAK
jgi:hypothetical protein